MLSAPPPTAPAQSPLVLVQSKAPAKDTVEDTRVLAVAVPPLHLPTYSGLCFEQETELGGDS